MSTNHQEYMNNNGFDDLWRQVESYENDRLPQSAYKVVEEIYNKAKAEKADDQLIKAAIYKLKLSAQFEDKDPADFIIELEEEKGSLTSVSAQRIFASLLAELYHQYGMRNMGHFENRTSLTKEKSSNKLELMSLEDIQNISNKFYVESLQDVTDIDISSFDLITKEATDKRYNIVVNSLRQFLMIRAIQHFSNSQSLLTIPVGNYVLDNKELFGPDDVFAKIELPSTEIVDYKVEALKLFQIISQSELFSANQKLQFHLKRLEYLKMHSSLTMKQTHYVDALKEIIRLEIAKGEEMLPHSQMAFVKLIEHYLNDGGLQSKGLGGEDENNNYQEAYRWIQKSNKTFENGVFDDIVLQQKKLLNEETLKVQTEEVVLPDNDFLMHVKYRNTNRAFFKLVRLNDEVFEAYNKVRRQEDKLRFLLDEKTFREWNVVLPQADDFNPHSIEVPAKSLEEGRYALLSSNNAEFKFDNDLIDLINIFQVSNLSYIHQNNNNALTGYVLNRANGTPVRDALIEVYSSKYDPKNRKTNWKMVGKITSDKNGAFSYNAAERNFALKIIKDDDVLDLRTMHYNYGSPDSQSRNSVNLFTDRAIYRPGQIVYFKGLAIKQNTKDRLPEVLSNQKVKVTFKDANWQDISSQAFKTNEYGTFNGEFIAPSSGLLGQFSISVEINNGSGNTYFRIEEYKRPKFYVEFDTLKAAYTLGDTIESRGKLVAFSGAPMSGTQIKYYVVKRQAYRPYYFWSKPFTNRPEEIIERGTIESNSDGSFEIRFPTNKTANGFGRFNYEVKVEATDISGITASKTKSMLIGDVPFNFMTNLPSNIFKDDVDNFDVDVTNSEGAYVPVTLEMKVFKLKHPEIAKKAKYWEYPDINYLDSTSYVKQFPKEIFSNAFDPSTWASIKVVKEEQYDVDAKRTIEFDNLDKGAYRFDFIVKDDKGNSKLFQRFLNVSSQSGAAIPTDYIWHSSLKDSYAPGEDLSIDVSVPFKKSNVYYSLVQGDRMIKEGWIKKSEKEISYKIKEADRGNLELQLLYVKDNRFYAKNATINVPWNNKSLDITIESFRDKVLPGSNEEWGVNVKDFKGRDTEAEVLAAMYDSSLDQFVAHKWKKQFYPIYSTRKKYNGAGFRLSNSLVLRKYYRTGYQTAYSGYTPSLNWFGFYLPYGNYGGGQVMHDGAVMKRSSKIMSSRSSAPMMEAVEEESMESDAIVSNVNNNDNDTESKEGADKSIDGIQVRENLNETVFFYPSLQTDNKGNTELSFKMNEALTKWNLLLFTHTKDFKYSFDTYTVETKKDLIIEPTLPRFLRQGDKILLNAKVSNLSDNDMSVVAEINLKSANKTSDITTNFITTKTAIPINLSKGETTTVTWELNVPDTFTDALDVTMHVGNDSVSDGERNRLQVMSNRMLVTETMVMNVGALENAVFKFDAMQKIDQSQTLDNYKYVVEFYNNPSWLVLKSLPSMSMQNDIVTTNIFDAYYAQSLGLDLVSKDASIKNMIELWIAKNEKGSLSKNEELKLSQLNETPWVRDAMLENENIRLLVKYLDENTVKQELKSLARALKQRVLSNGGFVWTPGSRDNWFITQYILEGISRLRRLNVNVSQFEASMINDAVNYIDQSLKEHHEKRRSDKIYLSPLVIQYLYIRPQFDNVAIGNELEKIIKEYQDLAKEDWKKRGTYEQAMIGYGFELWELSADAKMILNSLTERMIVDKEMGNYWNDQAGYYWYNLDVEKQSFMIDFYKLMDQDQSTIDGLKLWLLKNKQTNSWKSSKATASAVYAFMSDKDEWLTSQKYVSLEMPQLDSEINFEDKNVSGGYVKKTWEGHDVGLDLAELKVSNPNNHISWGAAYWQYFEDLDKVEHFEGTPLKLNKTLFKVVASDSGDKMVAIPDSNQLQPGDRIRSRIELRVDRPMEFVEMKDLRASGVEPINVLSQYKWQDGLGYYESTKDLATYFYFDYLPKGNFVFEYDTYVVHPGEFSNGFCSIQSMYAPEFSSHSNGTTLNIIAKK